MLKNMGPFFFLLILISCGEKKSIHLGMTSKDELIELKGGPLKTDVTPAGEVLAFKDNEKFQLSDGKVTSTFRDPRGDEKNLIFWRHQFKECQTSEKALSEDQIPEIELNCPVRGQSVVFLKDSGKVIRVSEYESR